VVQVGPPVQLFLDRRDGSHFLIEGVKLDHRARGRKSGPDLYRIWSPGHRVGSDSFTRSFTRELTR
jgi:hypothetical protein